MLTLHPYSLSEATPDSDTGVGGGVGEEGTAVGGKYPSTVRLTLESGSSSSSHAPSLLPFPSVLASSRTKLIGELWC